MRFMLVATAPKSANGAPSNPKVLAAIGKLSEELSHGGVLIETGGLGSSEKGARLRLSGGRVTVTDGPFTEAKELAGGYAIVQVNSKEEAIELGHASCRFTRRFSGRRSGQHAGGRPGIHGGQTACNRQLGSGPDPSSAPWPSSSCSSTRSGICYGFSQSSTHLPISAIR